MNRILKLFSLNIWLHWCFLAFVLLSGLAHGQSLKLMLPVGHTNRITSVAFSPDGSRILTASDDKTAKVWDARQGVLLLDLASDILGRTGHDGKLRVAAFNLQATRLVTASEDNTARIWDASQGTLLLTLQGHKQAVTTAEFSPDGTQVLTAAFDNSARLWDARSGALLHRLALPDPRPVLPLPPNTRYKMPPSEPIEEVLAAHFSPDGRRIVLASRRIVQVRDVQKGTVLLTLEGPGRRVLNAVFSPDGTRIATASEATFNPGQPRAGQSIGESLFTSPPPSEVARIWDAQKGTQLAEMKGHSSSVRTVRFSPDGRALLTSSYDETAKLWDVQNGKLLLTLPHPHSLLDARFSPDGRRVLTVTDLLYPDRVAGCLWDSRSGKQLIQLRGHGASLAGACFSPDGTRIATASWDKTAVVWDTKTGQPLTTLSGHSSPVLSAQFSPDGTRIATFSNYYVTGESRVSLWDAQKGTLQPSSETMQAWQYSSNNADEGKYKLYSHDAITDIKRTADFSLVYSFLAIDSTDYLVFDRYYHYDGTERARRLLYFTCGSEIIGLDQVKDQLWVPNLAERLMKGEVINAKSMDDLQLCNLTPQVRPTPTKTTKEEGYHFQVQPQKGGLGETVLLVNNIEVRRYQPTELLQPGGGYELNVRRAELAPYFMNDAPNTVTVKSYTKLNYVASRGAHVVDNQSPATVSRPNLYAVLVGVSDYKGTDLDLKYAAKDAQDLAGALGASARKLLNSDGQQHVFLYQLTTAAAHDRLPEKTSIRQTFEEIGRKATANDIVLVFMAGHGKVDEQDKKFYFLTADASSNSAVDVAAEVGISTLELADWLQPSHLKAQKRVLILDACNSGQAINETTSNLLGIKVRNDDQARQTKALSRLNEQTGLFILAASASNQSAYETSHFSQGLLTYCLLDALRNHTDVLEDQRYLNVGRWFDTAQRTLSILAQESGLQQEAQVHSVSNFNLGLVDAEVRASIVLARQKPLFSPSNVQNQDELVAADDLGLSQLLNEQLSTLAGRGDAASFVFAEGTASPDAYSLTGRYAVQGQRVRVQVDVRKGNASLNRFEESGTRDDLKLLVTNIVAHATDWVEQNK